MPSSKHAVIDNGIRNTVPQKNCLWADGCSYSNWSISECTSEWGLFLRILSCQAIHISDVTQNLIINVFPGVYRWIHMTSQLVEVSYIHWAESWVARFGSSAVKTHKYLSKNIKSCNRDNLGRINQLTSKQSVSSFLKLNIPGELLKLLQQLLKSDMTVI